MTDDEDAVSREWEHVADVVDSLARRVIAAEAPWNAYDAALEISDALSEEMMSLPNADRSGEQAAMGSPNSRSAKTMVFRRPNGRSAALNPTAAPRVAMWAPYVTIGVPLVLGLLLWWVLPGAIGGWLVVPFWILTYFVMRTLLRRLFAACGLD